MTDHTKPKTLNAAREALRDGAIKALRDSAISMNNLLKEMESRRLDRVFTFDILSDPTPGFPTKLRVEWDDGSGDTGSFSADTIEAAMTECTRLALTTHLPNKG